MERKSNVTRRGHVKSIPEKSAKKVSAKKKAVGRARKKRTAPRLTVVTTETWTITWGQDPALGAQILGEPVIVVRESVEIFPEGDVL